MINRDEPSRQNLMRSHLNEVPIVGADPVIILEPRAVCAQHLDASVIEFLNAHQIKFGICISSQQPVLQLDELAAWLDAQIIARGAGIVFIPMNPITDLETSQQILSRMHHKTQVCILKGVRSPEVIAGITQQMNLVISSRLHLLILASLSHTPCLGIERGSKVRVFLSQLGQEVVGTTDCINFTRLDNCVNDVMTRSVEFKAAACNGRKRMLARLERVSSIFGRAVQEVLQRKGEREFISAKIKESNIDQEDVGGRNMKTGG